MVGNPMHTEVSADASDYVSSLQTAINRTDELDQQTGQAARGLDRLGEDATSTSARLGAFSASAMGATASTRALSTATTASLVPALGALSTTIVPLTAALGGLAAAASGVAAGFTAVIGTGAYAYGEQLAEQNEQRLEQINQKIESLETLREETGSLTDAQQERLSSLKETRDEVEETTSVTGALSQEMQPVRDQLHETAMTLGSSFVPLIRDAIDALPAFIRRMEEAIGPLQPFADALRDAGQVAFRVIPEITRVVMDMGREALPAIRDLGSFIAEYAVPALKGMWETTGRVAEIMPDMGETLVDVIPTLNDFGLEVLEVVVPALEEVGGKVVDTIDAFEELDNETQRVSIGAALVAPGVFGIITKLSMISPLLGGIGAAVAGLGAAWATNFRGMRDHVGNLVKTWKETGSISAVLKQLIEGGASWLAEEGIPLLSDIAGTLLGTLTDLISPGGQSPGVGGAGGLLSAFVQRIGDVLDGVSTWLNDEGGSEKISQFVQDFMGNIASALENNEGAISDITNDFIGVLGGMFDTIIEVLQSDEAQELSTQIGKTVGIILREFAEAAVEYAKSDEFMDDLEGLGSAVWNASSAVIAGAAMELAPEGSGAPNSRTATQAQIATPFDIKDSTPEELAGELGVSEERAAELIESAREQDLSDVHTGGYIESSGVANLEEGERVIPPAQVTDRGQVTVEGGGGGKSEVVVRFEGEGSLVDLVRSEAEVVVDKKQKQQSRTSNSLHQNPGISK